MSKSAAQRTTLWLMNSEPPTKSTPKTGNGTHPTAASRAEMMCFSALFRIERVKVHPVSTSVMFTVRVDSPWRVGPQWATVSTSKNPGSASISPAGLADLDGAAKANGPVLVVDLPRSCSVARTGAR